jgi:two-component system response regulator PilR (NtrC family)
VPDGGCRQRAIIDPCASATRALPNVIEDIERKAIEQALTDDRYNKTKAAARVLPRLGIAFRALRYKLKKLGDRVAQQQQIVT